MIEVAGIIPWKDRKRNARNIGVVFGQRSHLWWDLPLLDSFKLIAKMYGVSQQQFRSNIEQFVDLLDMDDFIETPVRQLSLGQRMRGDLVAVMLYEPRILYLDEPTIGLDVVAKERIRHFIKQINQLNSTTIILTTHDLTDVERLCHRIILIGHGHILYDGSIDRLKEYYMRRRILTVQLSREDATVEVADAKVLRRDGAKIWLEYDPNHVAVASLISEIHRLNPIIDLSVSEVELEPIVRQIYGND